MPKPPEGLTSRDRILWAAATMLGEDPGSALSVRAVAARARVSTGSLQHHFPTQRALMDSVLAIVYDLVLPDDSVQDASIPARDRLVACLQRLVALPGAGVSAREAWIQTFDRFPVDGTTEAARAEYLAIERELCRRIEVCLAVLQQEGALPPGDNARRARYLFTLVTGLSVARALPGPVTQLQNELDVLHTAADHVLGGSG